MSIIVFLLFCLLLERKFADAVIIYAPFYLMFPMGVTLVGGISMNFCISVLVFLLCLWNSRTVVVLTPILKGCLFLTISILITALYPRLAPSLLAPLGSMLYCSVLFVTVNSEKRLNLLVKSIVAFILVFTINGVIEFVTPSNTNILGDLIRSMMHEGRFFVENGVQRNGMHRTNSCFAHCIAFGVVSTFFLYACFVLKNNNLLKGRIFYVLILLLGISMYISNARTPLLAFVVLCAGLLPTFVKSGKMLILIIIAAFAVGGSVYKFMDTAITSMFTDNNDYAGSSLDLRIRQLEYSFYLIKDRPLLGLSTDFSLDQHAKILKGMESVWFGIIISRGWFGILGYISMYILLFIQMLKNQNKLYLAFLLIGWLVANSSSNMSGLDDYCLWFLFVLMFKMGEICGKQRI